MRNLVKLWNQKRELAKYRWIAERIPSWAEFYSRYMPEEILHWSRELEKEVLRGKVDFVSAASQAFGIASVTFRRVLHITPNSTQLVAALFLADGDVVELGTGEGKTIVAMLASYLRVLHGYRVHVGTTNDYLAERDYHWMNPMYEALGIGTGLVLSTTSRKKRKEEYEKRVVYVTIHELGFDYMNDHLSLSKDDVVLNHFDFAIIDEVDSVLIDEARTPMIIAERSDTGAAKDSFSRLRRATEIVRELGEEDDYEADERHRDAVFTDAGIEKIISLLGRDIFSEKDTDTIRAFELALFVKAFLKKDREYIIRDGKVCLVDEFTGHLLVDRQYIQGLHQALELAEGIEPTPENRTSASITYRNLFRLYRSLSGMTGTAYEVADEFFRLYGLDVIPLPPHYGLKRSDLPTRFFRSNEDKFLYVAKIIKDLGVSKAPVLLVARTIQGAKACSDYLSKRNISHTSLHAELSASETEIIQNAGLRGAITVATNMAGRGADFIIEKNIAEKTGLRVIGLEHNFSERVDNQLRGRSGRLGARGETRFVASLEDELLQAYVDEAFWNYVETIAWSQDGIVNRRLSLWVKAAQSLVESLAADSRSSLARFDTVVDSHRHAMYEFRDKVLFSEDPTPVILSHLYHILRKEEFSFVTERELRDRIGHSSRGVHPVRSKLRRDVGAADAQAHRTSNGVNDFIISFLGGDYSYFLAFGAREKEDARRITLRAIDRFWEKYLENISVLEDAVSLVAIGGSDPLYSFIDDADKIFHDVRKRLALTVFENLIKLMIP